MLNVQQAKAYVLRIRTVRQACEHICFSGAAVDLVAFTVHWEAYPIHLIGKLAFVMGAAGIYLMHVEEHKHRKGQ